MNESGIAQLLETEFQLPPIESRIYIRLVTTPDRFSKVVEELGVTETAARVQLGEEMVRKGLLIRSSSTNQEYVALHPRMVLSNIFKMFEKDLVQLLRDRRATVDRIVNLLTPYYEEKKATAGD